MAPQVNISLGGCGSNEVTFGTLLGGTVLFLPVKRLRVVASYRHPR